MADEAHRTQYGFKQLPDEKGEGIKYGYAKYLRDALPNASFHWFYWNTCIFNKIRIRKWYLVNYIDVYDMTQSVEDGGHG